MSRDFFQRIVKIFTKKTFSAEKGTFQKKKLQGWRSSGAEVT